MTEQTGNNKPNEAEGLAFPLSGNAEAHLTKHIRVMHPQEGK